MQALIKASFMPLFRAIYESLFLSSSLCPLSTQTLPYSLKPKHFAHKTQQKPYQISTSLKQHICHICVSIFTGVGQSCISRCCSGMNISSYKHNIVFILDMPLSNISHQINRKTSDNSYILLTNSLHTPRALLSWQKLLS